MSNIVSPILTIAIPTYNRSDKLNKHLVNINTILFNYERSNFIELLISDNCSTDETYEICKKHDAIDKNYTFTYLKNESNVGSERNFIEAILKSSGKYVWLMGDDDTICDNSIEYIVNILENNYEVGFFFINYYKDVGKTSAMIQVGTDTYCINFDDFVSSTISAFGMISAGVYKREILNRESMYSYVDTFLPHVFWIIDIVKKYDSFIIREPLFIFNHPGVVETRRLSRENKRGEKEASMDNWLMAHLSLLDLIKYIDSLSTSFKTRIKLYRYKNNENFNQIIHYKTTINKYDFSTIKHTFFIMLQHFYFSPAFWVLHIPVLFLPGYFAKSIAPLRWKYIDFRGRLARLFF